MEKNADVHGDPVGSDTTGREAGDAPAAGVGKGTAEKCTNSEVRLTTLLENDSWNNSTTEDPGAPHVKPGAGRCDLAEVLDVRDAGKDTESSGEQTISNGMGSGPDKEGGASKLVNNQTDEPSSGVDGKESKSSKLAETGRTSPEDSSAPRALSEGLASGSDPDPDASLGGCESRSLDSLEESFSKLNSCPSSDLNSEGPEERSETGLALALHGEFGLEAAKAACAKDRAAGQSIYHIKWIKWREENTPIITQNENGPCPLLAIMNVLLLAWKVKMPPMMEIITAEQLMEYLGDYILETKPKEISEAQRLNYEQNMSDAMAVLHKLQTGLDVNVKFTGVRVFEYTPECIVFDLLDIPLYHGWLVDPQMHDIVKAVGNCSYNQLVEKIISCKQSDNSELAGEGIVAEQFLSSTATQLTYHGLCELTSTVQEGELCVFFRNNHFSTMIKYKGQLYLLVTDQGFLTEEKVVWESLHNVDGDGNFCDSEFRLRPPSDPETVYRGQQDQIDQDYLMALSLQQEQQSQDLQWEQLPGISDLELAKKLQEEEDRRASQYYQEQEQEQAAAAAAAQAQAQQEAAGADEADRGAAGSGGPAGGTGTAAAAAAGQATASPGKQSSGTERKAKKEAKEKDKCVIL
ncbi:ubiquitin carboxyl-terminal hydrolase MINDY-2 [Corythoichthys intestinalis]|uniref:ubiquitin carboxyl-terminal hydrolase MINDY-2 n=1 Tax=Corythoichthys intestinalis TaxID=161448 RepID=UPI0025A643D3|nr:ubiquitin carboxyl-terminal hydrolase MINDY-2 [Corythoichthys intestinalis]XP_061796163.1 ubiquitin carboxyl-terminal hydrolase MINDY-2-like [Nerophis lumbriciformis]